jgi:hypothetical protein
MGYELTSLKLQVTNNYVQVTRQEDDPANILPQKITMGWYNKSTSTFRMTYELVSDPKGDIWNVKDVIVSNGTTTISMSNEDIVANKIQDSKSLPFTMLTLTDFLSINTGV